MLWVAPYGASLAARLAKPGAGVAPASGSKFTTIWHDQARLALAGRPSRKTFLVPLAFSYLYLRLVTYIYLCRPQVLARPAPAPGIRPCFDSEAGQDRWGTIGRESPQANPRLRFCPS
jgi:hypothetical protein